MITGGRVMPMLVAACPSFGERWRHYISDSTYDEELLYVHLGELACHLVSLKKAEDTSEFEDVFRVVEELHLQGDAYVREAATIGLLEGIQNVSGNRDLDPESFCPYLRPESAKWWKKLNVFWSGAG